MTNILLQSWETHQGQTKMCSIRSVFFGCLGVTMVITLGDLRDKTEMWHLGLCLLNKAVLTDVKRKVVLKKRTKNTYVKKEWEHVSSLSKNKSSGSAKLGDPEPETTWNTQSYRVWEPTNTSFECKKDGIRHEHPKLVLGIRCSSNESAQNHCMCSHWRVCFLWLSWIRFDTKRDPPTVIHMLRLAWLVLDPEHPLKPLELKRN